MLNSFREGLARAGFVEGSNVRIEERWTKGAYETLPKLAAELVAMGVSAIAATGDVASARAAQNASTTVPVVFTIGGDPVRFGLVKALNRPGGHVTGILFNPNVLAAKRVELLREVAPSISRIRPRRVHAHVVERFRDRGGKSTRQRSETSKRPHNRLCALHRSAPWPCWDDGSGSPQDRQARADLDYGDEGRHARIREGETKGFMKILVDRDSKQILGASFLGLEGDEVIHCVLDIMYAKAPYTVIQRAMHIHPTVSEFIPTMMDQLKPLQ